MRHYLVERNGLYLSRNRTWVFDYTQARRFSRKEDATQSIVKGNLRGNPRVVRVVLQKV